MNGREPRNGGAVRAAQVPDGDDVQEALSGSFCTAPSSRAGDDESGARAEERRARAPEKPAHYKVICISLYTRDLERLDAMVDTLKARGLTKASRSALIRAALDQVDLDRIPRGI